MPKSSNSKAVCFECGADAEHHHHVVPRLSGGTQTVPLCLKCHSKAHKLKMTSSNLVKQAIQRRRENGQSWGRPRYGKKIVNDRFVDNPEEQKVIAIILRYGSDCVGAAAELNELGYKTRFGLEWTRFRVRDIRRKLVANLNRGA